MEGGVVGVFEFGFGKAFVVVDSSITDELDLRLTRDSFKVWVED